MQLWRNRAIILKQIIIDADICIKIGGSPKYRYLETLFPAIAGKIYMHKVVYDEILMPACAKEQVDALIQTGILELIDEENAKLFMVITTKGYTRDEMYRLQARSKRIIFSHETALYLHGLTNRDPLEWSVTVPRGYNGSNLRDEGIKVYTVKNELFQMGITELKTLYGRPIKVYDKERTISDIIRNRNNMDISILNESIKRYIENKDRNIPQLLRYAKELDVQNIIRNYMEILL